MKNSLTLASLANKYFNSLIYENDDPVYTYNEEHMRFFVCKSIKGGRCSALNDILNLSFLMKCLLLSGRNSTLLVKYVRL